MFEKIMFPEGGGITITNHPDTCPICHHRITPIMRLATFCGAIFEGTVRILYACPNNGCNEVFLGYFDKQEEGKIYGLVKTRPEHPRPIAISTTIERISKAFGVIYAQANYAEAMDLNEICGVGYRKALEFLIKEYLIKRRPEERSQIEKCN